MNKIITLLLTIFSIAGQAAPSEIATSSIAFEKMAILPEPDNAEVTISHVDNKEKKIFLRVGQWTVGEREIGFKKKKTKKKKVIETKGLLVIINKNERIFVKEKNDYTSGLESRSDRFDEYEIPFTSEKANFVQAILLHGNGTTLKGENTQAIKQSGRSLLSAQPEILLTLPINGSENRESVIVDFVLNMKGKALGTKNYAIEISVDGAPCSLIYEDGPYKASGFSEGSHTMTAAIINTLTGQRVFIDPNPVNFTISKK